MPFEQIENLAPQKSDKSVPVEGVYVETRSAGRGETRVRFIRLSIGGGLAKALGFHAETHGVQILFGTGRDTGKLCVSIDNATGQFKAKRSKKGDYSLTLNRATARGRFSTEFPAFAIQRLEAVKPENGGPRNFVFPASPEMLRVED